MPVRGAERDHASHPAATRLAFLLFGGSRVREAHGGIFARGMIEGCSSRASARKSASNSCPWSRARSRQVHHACRGDRGPSSLAAATSMRASDSRSFVPITSQPCSPCATALVTINHVFAVPFFASATTLPFSWNSKLTPLQRPQFGEGAPSCKPNLG